MPAWLPRLRVQRYLLFLLILLAGADLYVTASAEVTGSASLLYELTKEDGEWLGESEQRVNLSMRGRAGLENLLALDLGFIRRDKKLEFLGGLSPIYALSLKGRHYDLLSGYSIRVHKDIVTSRLYENLKLFLPHLPILTFMYAKQGIRDTQETHNINSTGSNIQFRLEDEIGPFRIALNRREYNSEDLVRGPEYNVKSADTSGHIDFAYLYRQLFSLNARGGIGRFHTQRGLRGEIEGETQDFSLGFRISPISTIALSGTTTGRLEQREGSVAQASLAVTENASLANRLQLMLQPVRGILLSAAYSVTDTSRDGKQSFFNEATSLMVNLEPWQNLVLSGYLTTYDSQQQGRKLSTLRRNSFDLNAELIEGLWFSSRLDLSESINLVTGLRSDRDNLRARLETMLTRNFRTDISYDWQKSSREANDESIDEEVQHRVAFAANYSFARMLDLNFRYGRDMSRKWEDSSFLNYGLGYSADGSHASVRYSRSSSPTRSSSLLAEEQRTTQTLTIQFEQEVGKDTRLFLSYRGRIGKRTLSYTGTRRISFRMSTRF